MDEEVIGEITISEKFQEPKKKFWLRSRKRPKSDAISINSLDISVTSQINKPKKRRKISEVANSIFSLNTSKIDKTSIADNSFLEIESATDVKKVGINNESTSLTIRSWVLDVAELDIVSSLSRQEIKKQEAIYELFCGENILLNDLCMLRDFFYHPLLSTNIFTVQEMDTIFQDISKFIQTHGKLRDDMVELRDRSGFTECIGPTFISWLYQLNDLYIERCKTQVWARYLLDIKKFSCKRFQEFLKKRNETSRSADLWTYLDSPRSRIVKYPLLIKEILKHTPTEHSDVPVLKQASCLLSELLKKIDKAMGDAECKLAKTRIAIRPEYDPNFYIENATELLTEGPLKDSRGIKFHCFLFNTCFALTRSSRRHGKKCTLCFLVVPTNEMNIELNSDKGLPSFKVGSHTLHTDDEHHRKHWLESFKRLFESSNSLIRQKSLIENDIKGKENKPESDQIKSKLNRRSKNNLKDGYFTISLRKTLLRQKRNSIDNT